MPNFPEVPKSNFEKRVEGIQNAVKEVLFSDETKSALLQDEEDDKNYRRMTPEQRNRANLGATRISKKIVEALEAIGIQLLYTLEENLDIAWGRMEPDGRVMSENKIKFTGVHITQKMKDRYDRFSRIYTVGVPISLLGPDGEDQFFEITEDIDLKS